MTDRYAEAVEAKIEQVAADIAAGRAEDGWIDPEYICEQAADEPVDVAGWLRGLDRFPKPAGADDLIATIVNDASLLHEAIERLKGMYGEA